MAEYTINVSHPKKLIEVIGSGEVDLAIYKEAAEAVAKLVVKHEYNVFYDLFNTRINLDVESLAQAPRTVKGKDNVAAHNIYTAAYVNNRDYQSWKFIEIQLHGLGFNGRVFRSKDDALAWLAENTRS